VWNVDRGVQAHHFALGGGTVWAVATVGNTALAGTDDGRIHALDLVRRRSTGSVLAHPGGVFALAAAGGRVISAGADGHGRVWDAHLRRALASRSARASAGAAAIASGRIAVGFDDGVARVYDLPRAKIVARLPHEGLVLGAAFRSDGQLVTACEDDAVRVWDIDGASPTIVWSHAAPAVAVAVGPDDSVVSAGADGVVATPDARLDLSSAGDSPLSLAFSPSGRTFAVGTRRGVILLYQR
jgi:WD40 repeat protein